MASEPVLSREVCSRQRHPPDIVLLETSAAYRKPHVPRDEAGDLDHDGEGVSNMGNRIDSSRTAGIHSLCSSTTRDPLYPNLQNAVERKNMIFGVETKSMRRPNRREKKKKDWLKD